jgi:hypothetical protein
MEPSGETPTGPKRKPSLWRSRPASGVIGCPEHLIVRQGDPAILFGGDRGQRERHVVLRRSSQAHRSRAPSPIQKHASISERAKRVSRRSGAGHGAPANDGVRGFRGTKSPGQRRHVVLSHGTGVRIPVAVPSFAQGTRRRRMSTIARGEFSASDGGPTPRSH